MVRFFIEYFDTIRKHLSSFRTKVKLSLISNANLPQYDFGVFPKNIVVYVLVHNFVHTDRFEVRNIGLFVRPMWRIFNLLLQRIVRLWNLCHLWFSSPLAQHWRFTDRVLKFLHCNHLESSISLNATWNAHLLACLRGLSCILTLKLNSVRKNHHPISLTDGSCIFKFQWNAPW